MTPNRLVLTERAVEDLTRRTRVLSRERGVQFARTWSEAVLTWLEKLAQSGAILGTQHPRHPAFRTFGYKRQATILAEFDDGEMRIIRIYFTGQDWAG